MDASPPSRSAPDPGAQQFPAWDLRAYDYELPPHCIAQTPAPERDASRLMLYARTHHAISHHVFHDLPELLRPDDLLVLNDCRVIPARLHARRCDTGTLIEVLLTECVHDTVWRALVKPGRSCRPGTQLSIGRVAAHVTGIDPDGQRLLQFQCTPDEVAGLLDLHGDVPLPPYIARAASHSSDEDRERYQTVYAAHGAAVAAPTAGLHFTPELLARIRRRGIGTVTLTLDVGPGTFQPVKCHDIRRHQMHSEHFVLPHETAAALNAARRRNSRIIAVGTTALRALEACLDESGVFQPRTGATALFIYPPYSIRSIDGLITNFHLPRSTLLMLVAAWVGTDVWRTLYTTAIRDGYRFYSYGDAMLLV
jgi:S-adenosylmethionine:tRNA ribosyltransferase-isomerase